LYIFLLLFVNVSLFNEWKGTTTFFFSYDLGWKRSKAIVENKYIIEKGKKEKNNGSSFGGLFYFISFNDLLSNVEM